MSAWPIAGKKVDVYYSCDNEAKPSAAQSLVVYIDGKEVPAFGVAMDSLDGQASAKGLGYPWASSAVVRTVNHFESVELNAETGILSWTAVGQFKSEKDASLNKIYSKVNVHDLFDLIK